MVQLTALSTALVAAAATVDALPTGSGKDNSTSPQSRPYWQWLADSQIAYGVEPTFKYATQVLYRGIQYTAQATGESSYRDFIYDQTEPLLTSNGTIKAWDRSPGAQKSLDDILVGNIFLDLWQRTNETKFKLGADFLRNQINVQGRTPGGGLWHRDPRYTNQMWLDGIYMADVFYAHWTFLFDNSNTTAWDDILLQFQLIEEHTRNATTGLLYHGFDAAKTQVWADPETGASPYVWDRALGWYFMALIDTLDYFPSSHPGHEILTDYFTSLAAAVKKTQDPATGGWWLLMDPELAGKEGNYIESSGTAMFTYGFAKGVSKGLLAADEYTPLAQRAEQLMIERFVASNGTFVDWYGTVEVGSLSGDASYEYYTGVPTATNDPKGLGPFIFASVELEMAEGSN